MEIIYRKRRFAGKISSSVLLLFLVAAVLVPTRYAVGNSAIFEQSGWDYDLKKKCVKSPHPGEENYFEDTGECEDNQNWTIAVQSEASLGNSCPGPKDQSFPLNQTGSPVKMRWSPKTVDGERKWSINLHTDLSANTHPCGAGNFTWFVLMDHIGHGGGPFPRPDKTVFSATVNYNDFVTNGGIRAIAGWGGRWDGKYHVIELQFQGTVWGDNYPDDPKVVNAINNGNLQYVHVNGSAYGISVPKLVNTPLTIPWYAIIKDLIDKGYIDAPINGWESAETTNLHIGHELYNRTASRAAIASLWISDFKVDRIADEGDFGFGNEPVGDGNLTWASAESIIVNKLGIDFDISGPEFSDMSSAYPYHKPAKTFYNKVHRYSCAPTRYCPDAAINKGTFVYFAMKAAGIEPVSSEMAVFTDSSWMSPYTTKAVELGITTSESPTVFGQRNLVSREEGIEMVNRIKTIIGSDPDEDDIYPRINIDLARSFGGAPLSDAFGISTLNSNSDPADFINVGTEIVRIAITGLDRSSFDYDALEGRIAKAKEAGMKIILLLRAAPFVNAQPLILVPAPGRYPDNPAEFQELLRELVSRYKDDIDYWQIENEVNTHTFLYPLLPVFNNDFEIDQDGNIIPDGWFSPIRRIKNDASTYKYKTWGGRDGKSIMIPVPTNAARLYRIASNLIDINALDRSKTYSVTAWSKNNMSSGSCGIRIYEYDETASNDTLLRGFVREGALHEFTTGLNDWNDSESFGVAQINLSSLDPGTRYLKIVLSNKNSDGVCWFDDLNAFNTFWADSNENYVRHLRESYQTIKSADADATVLLAGLSKTNIEALETFMSLGAGAYFDAVDFHYYYRIQRNEWGPSPAEPAGIISSRFNRRSFADTVAYIKDTLSRYGAEKSLWLGETSAPTDMPDYAGSDYTDELRQAEEVVKRFVLAFATGVDKAFWLVMDDNPDLASHTDRSGLKRADGARKKSYGTYVLITDKLAGSGFIGAEVSDISSDTTNYVNTYHFKDTDNGRDTLVVWLSDLYPSAFHRRIRVSLAIAGAERDGRVSVINAITNEEQSIETYTNADGALVIKGLQIDTTPRYIILD